MSYEPGRKDGYYYIWELMADIEERQCRTCVFSKIVDDPKNEPHSSEYPMCFQIEGEIVAENGPVEALDKTDDGVVCSQYRNADRALEARGQGRLFDEGLGSASS